LRQIPISSTDNTFLFSVSETGEGLGESETATGRDSQLCGQGKMSSLLCEGGINHLFKIEILLAVETNGIDVGCIHFILKQLH